MMQVRGHFQLTLIVLIISLLAGSTVIAEGSALALVNCPSIGSTRNTWSLTTFAARRRSPIIVTLSPPLQSM
jgi:hypothetical protein